MTGGPDRFRQVHVAALALAAVMLPWSEFLLSNAQFLLVGNWLVGGLVRRDLAARFRRAFTDPAALVFLSFFGIHVLGLLWTDDLAWGLDLCRILLPVLAFTPILAERPRLAGTELRTVLLLGAWSAVASTLACLLLRHELIAQGAYRELSVFISHIRLALLLCFAVVVLVRYWPAQPWSRLAHVLAIGWCIVFLNLLGSLTGLFLLGVVACWGVWRWSRGRSAAWRITVTAALVALPLAAGLYLRHCVQAYSREVPADLALLEDRSAGGEVYLHDRRDPLRENGRYVWINVADGELERGWARRSATSYSIGTDGRGQPLRFTLLRYMTSLGLKKDSVGLAQLSDEDVRRVEHGITNAAAGRRNMLRERIDQVLYELERYRATGDASGFSVAMRLEFLRTGWHIAQEHLLAGVGTGDTRPAFAEAYVRMDTPLAERWRLRAHDQYLTLWISFGLPGLLWCLFSWWWPARRNGAFREPLFVGWALIFGISALAEDTLETQMGATFFAFHYALLVFAAPQALTGPAGPAPARG